MVCAACDGIFTEFMAPGKCPVCRAEFKPKAVVVSTIPPIELNVADTGTSSVSQVPAPVADADPVELPKPAAKRQPVDHMTANLYWPFIIMMGRIAKYAQDKYGSVEQYADGRLEGEKSPINHAIAHIADYIQRKPHDKFGDLRMQLVAGAYNLMMELVYLDQGGEPTVPAKLYTRGAE